MKNIGLLMLLTLSLSVFATESVILTKTYNKNDKWELYRTQYKVNTDLGRAWFKIELADMSPFDDLDYQDARVMPEGMYFDQATGDIMINDTVCATTKSSRRYLKIYPTGNCEVRGEERKVQIDDGYNIITKKQLNIILTVN
ncbi:MAG: hypothetical protein CME62_16885 [Halobacteriovoraceae bacterium]|nr:hypothetical protein [Halobacteriovoraceae bacterium]|tara:strand:- start:18323 stop:18748 length:426 start_codon:yes stop_codon:yes gene_type:complete